MGHSLNSKTFFFFKIGLISYEPPHDKTTKWHVCPAKLRSAWPSAQSDQDLRSPHDKSLCPYLPIECTAKTLIRLSGCPG